MYAVVEIYSDWAGPCKAINGTCKRLYFDLGDKGLKFYTAAAGTLGFTAPYKGKCKPVFTFWKGGEELKELRLEGVNAPLFTKQIMAKLDEVA